METDWLDRLRSLGMPLSHYAVFMPLKNEGNRHVLSRIRLEPFIYSTEGLPVKCKATSVSTSRKETSLHPRHTQMIWQAVSRQRSAFSEGLRADLGHAHRPVHQ